MKFARPNGGILVLDNSAESVINSFQQHSSCTPESGGMLLGRVLIDSGHIIIDQATIPDKKDKRGRFFFIRSRSAAQREVENSWRESSGTRNYLGEWHTHPEAFPTPSPKDRKNWRRIMKKARYHQEMLFFLISGTNQLRIWELAKESDEALLLERID